MVMISEDKENNQAFLVNSDQNLKLEVRPSQTVNLNSQKYIKKAIIYLSLLTISVIVIVLVSNYFILGEIVPANSTESSESSDNTTQDSNWLIYWIELLSFIIICVKYGIAFFLFFLGFKTVIKIRTELRPKKINIIMGALYLLIGFGIMFNYFIMILCFALKGKIFEGFVLSSVSNIIESAKTDQNEELIEDELKFIKLILGLVSICFLVFLIYALWSLILREHLITIRRKKNRKNFTKDNDEWIRKKKEIKLLFYSFLLCCIFGFNTGLDILLKAHF